MKKIKVKKGAFFSLMLASLVALTACNNEESFDMPDAGKLSINVGVNHSTSRALITDATLPDGDAGAIGVMLSDGDGTITDYDAYTNVKFTGSTASGSQKWTGETDVLLTENPGTLYAYYPWKDGTNLSAIAIETASQTDYLYATPVTGISETKANADVDMNHVLTNINLSFADGTYAGVGNITSVSVSGDGIATGGTFNAAQETPGFVADSYTGVGDAITNTTATTLGGNAIDIMVVSNDVEKPITIAATIDGVEYTATTTAVELAKGNSYQYTLTLNSTFMSVSKVTVTEWNPVTKDNLTLGKNIPNVSKVYAVRKSDKALVEIDDIDTNVEEYIAVALYVTGKDFEQKFWIEKNEYNNAAYGGQTMFYWGNGSTDITGLTNYNSLDGTNSQAYLPKPDGTYLSTPKLSSDYTTWTAGALSDFNGFENTKLIVEASTSNTYISGVLNAFNTATDGQNQGFSDWYIPAFGQLSLIHLNVTEINKVLDKIGGTPIKLDFYWSSSEFNNERACVVFCLSGEAGSYYKKDDFYKVPVRFIRDFN